MRHNNKKTMRHDKRHNFCGMPKRANAMRVALGRVAAAALALAVAAAAAPMAASASASASGTSYLPSRTYANSSPSTQRSVQAARLANQAPTPTPTPTPAAPSYGAAQPSLPYTPPATPYLPSPASSASSASSVPPALYAPTPAPTPGASAAAPASGTGSSTASNTASNMGSNTASNTASASTAASPSADNGAGQQQEAEAEPSVPMTEAARICASLGVLRGNGNGVDGVYLAKTVTRIQAIFITLRLLGKEADAMAGNTYPNFNDAGQVTDNLGLCALAYMRANPQLGWQGDEGGMIDPYGYVTVQTMSKVLLSALGYEVGVDFSWDDTVEFAAEKGMKAPPTLRTYITNSDFAAMLVNALKTRMKDSEETLVEALVAAGVVDGEAAAEAAMLPGTSGFEPLLTYAEGGPLLVEVHSSLDAKYVKLRFNTGLNPAYAKATKNYRYYVPGSGYMPLPSRCATKMVDESTVDIQFPADGWAVIGDFMEKDAYRMFIATSRNAELLVSGLQDVDGNDLPDLYVDVPE